MARTSPPIVPVTTHVLHVERSSCPHCGSLMRRDYDNFRTVRSLSGAVRLHLRIRRCCAPTCPRFRLVARPEAEGRYALPGHEFGLDVVALVGALRHRQHRSVPEIHLDLEARGLQVSQRTVSNLLACYDELVAVSAATASRLPAGQDRAILAIDGLAPAVGHEVLWVIRECISGSVVLARTMLSATTADLATLLEEARKTIGVPIVAVVSDGQRSIGCAVAKALPDVPHQLCHFHYLREASRPVFEADRHAKKELKKRVRGVRTIEREAAKAGERAPLVEGYTAAVRAALDSEGKVPLDAPGVRLRGDLQSISESLEKVDKKGGPAKRSRGSRPSSTKR